MKLTSFRVRGFKNFTNWVVLEDLSEINVIHGPNNVGKSNLLQAMLLFFRLLREVDERLGREHGERSLTGEDLKTLGIEPYEVFNLRRPVMPIELSGRIQLDGEELPRGHAEIKLVLTWIGPHAKFNLGTFNLNGRDAREGSVWSLAVEFARTAAWSVSPGEEGIPRFAYIPSLRPIDDQLALQLYDAKESTEPNSVHRWNRYVEAMRFFSDIVGEGSFVAIYERKLQRANLLFDTGETRILLKLLGSGVQQAAMLVGHLLMTKASIVAIEEPEQNLKFDLQERLGEVFAGIVGKQGGPSQLFLTSHSPTFESGDHFYFMKPGPDGPIVEKRSNAEAMIAVGYRPEVSDLPGKATLSYVSTDGIVRLPERVMKVIEMPQGGGVMFIDRDRSVEMMSNARFLEELGLEDADDNER
jgi:hypothetical protein